MCERKILILYNTISQKQRVRGLSNEKSKVIIVHSTVKQLRMSCVVLILKRDESAWKKYSKHPSSFPSCSVYNIIRVLHISKEHFCVCCDRIFDVFSSSLSLKLAQNHGENFKNPSWLFGLKRTAWLRWKLSEENFLNPPLTHFHAFTWLLSIIPHNSLASTDTFANLFSWKFPRRFFFQCASTVLMTPSLLLLCCLRRISSRS